MESEGRFRARLATISFALSLLSCGAVAQSVGSGTPTVPDLPELLQPQPLPLVAPLSPEERADLMMVRKRFDEAIDILTPLAHQQRNAGLYNKLGIAYQQIRDTNGAERAYKQALRLDPGMADAWNNLGTVYFEERNLGKANKFYTRAIHLRKDAPAFFVNRGTVAFERRKLKQAQQDFLAALRLNPEALDPDANIGTIIEDRSGLDAGQYEFMLARLYCSLGRYDEAMHHFRRSLERHYSHYRDVYRDPVFKGLLIRPDFKAIMAAEKNSAAS
jgi:tetratricopeptide (TPR) repeat protein